MKVAVLVLSALGILVGVVMIFLGMSAREIRSTQLSLIVGGFLIAVVSLVVLFVAKVIISQRK